MAKEGMLEINVTSEGLPIPDRSRRIQWVTARLLAFIDHLGRENRKTPKDDS